MISKAVKCVYEVYLVDIVLRKNINFDEGVTFPEKIHLWEVLQVQMMLKKGTGKGRRRRTQQVEDEWIRPYIPRQ